MKKIPLLFIFLMTFGCKLDKGENYIEFLAFLAQSGNSSSYRETATDDTTTVDTPGGDTIQITVEGGGAHSYIVWGDTTCADGYSVAYEGYIYFSHFYNGASSPAYSSGPLCLSKTLVDADNNSYIEISGSTSIKPLCGANVSNCFSGEPKAPCIVCVK